MRTQVKLLIYILCIVSSAVAQDAHHSQFFNQPAYYNPAFAGHEVEHIRLTGIYRKQWPASSVPFVTQSLIFDKQVSKVGFGALINKNAAGDAGLQRMQFGGMVSYRYVISDHAFAAGMSIGFIQKSFDPSKMTFDDQYMDDKGYDPANPTAEQFAFTKVIRPDFSAGFLYSYGDISNNKMVPHAGFSIMHINQPEEVLIEQSNFTPRKTSLQAGTRFRVDDKLELNPSVVMSWQQFSNEMLYGIRAGYKTDTRSKVEGGIYIRNKDAAIAYAGYQWNSLMVGVSYDVVTSNAVSGPGAFELSLTYIPKARPKKVKKPVAEKTTAPKSTAAKTATVKPKEVKPAEPKTVQSKPAAATPAKSTVTLPVQQKKTENILQDKPKPVTTKPVQENKPAVKTETPKQVLTSPQQAVTTPVAKPVTKEVTPKAADVKTTPVPKETAPPAPKQTPTVQKPTSETISSLAKTENKKLESTAPVTDQSAKTEAIKSTPATQKKTDSAPAIKSSEVNKPTVDNKAADIDADGVPDVSDECPATSGSAAAKGCPDRDNDAIADAKDKCPDEKGAINNNGCPEIYEKLPFDKTIYFDEYSSEVHPFDMIDILEPVTDTLFFNPSFKLVISGYAFGEGDEKSCKDLSDQRAEKLKEFFISRGIPAEKIETMSFGNTRAAEGVENRINRKAEIYIRNK